LKIIIFQLGKKLKDDFQGTFSWDPPSSGSCTLCYFSISINSPTLLMKKRMVSILKNFYHISTNLLIKNVTDSKEPPKISVNIQILKLARHFTFIILTNCDFPVKFF
jgi:hypothetical protein